MKTRRQNSLGVLLRITAFRRMWLALSVSSLGDWLGLLATTALAAYLTKDASNLVQGAAVSGVLLTRLLPDLILGPIAGALVDRFDRRKVAIVGDAIAGLLYLSIVLAGNLTWLLAAQFLVEAVGLFSNPAKQALWVNIVPRERLAVANQLNYVSVYGMVPVAAVVFALLATTAQFFGAPPVPDAGATGALISATSAVAIKIALVLDAASYFLAAGVLFLTRRLIPPYLGDRPPAKSVFSLIREGVGFVKNSRVMRAIYVGILGAFGAGGLVAGVAQAYVATLGAGNAGYGILFGTVFSGLALGMLIGPKVLPAVPRRIVFTLCIGAAGCALVVMSLLQDFVGAAVASVVMGLFAGIAWITGFTMIGHEVSDRLRGRVFAFVMSSVRLTLLGSIAVGPILANGIGFHLLSVGTFRMVLSGPAIVLAVSGVLTIAVAVFAGRQVGGLRGERIRRVLARLLQRPRGKWLDARESLPGALIAVVGADSAATDRYARALVDQLDADGWWVHLEVAGTAAEPESAAEVMLEAAGDVQATGNLQAAGNLQTAGNSQASGDAASPTRTAPAARPEDTVATALRALADLSDLVTSQLRPMLEAGGVVVCRDYVDAAVVRFGAQAGMSEDRMIRLAAWATGGIDPDLTLLVDPLGNSVFTRSEPAGGGDGDADGDGTDGAAAVDGVVPVTAETAGVQGTAVAGVAGGDDATADRADAAAGPADAASGSGSTAATDARAEDVAGPAGVASSPAGAASGSAGAASGSTGAASESADDEEDEPVDPRRVYQDLAAAAPERYVAVPPLQDGEPIPAEVAERVASAVRSRAPILRDAMAAATDGVPVPDGPGPRNAQVPAGSLDPADADGSVTARKDPPGTEAAAPDTANGAGRTLADRRA